MSTKTSVTLRRLGEAVRREPRSTREIPSIVAAVVVSSALSNGLTVTRFHFEQNHVRVFYPKVPEHASTLGFSVVIRRHVASPEGAVHGLDDLFHPRQLFDSININGALDGGRCRGLNRRPRRILHRWLVLGFISAAKERHHHSHSQEAPEDRANHGTVRRSPAHDRIASPPSLCTALSALDGSYCRAMSSRVLTPAAWGTGDLKFGDLRHGCQRFGCLGRVWQAADLVSSEDRGPVVSVCGADGCIGCTGVRLLSGSGSIAV